MNLETNNINDWERQLDLAWLKENLDIFQSAAAEETKIQGRGAFAVDLINPPEKGEGNRCIYWPQAYLEEHATETVQQIVKKYDPDTEMVVMLLKPDYRISTYRVKLAFNNQ